MKKTFYREIFHFAFRIFLDGIVSKHSSLVVSVRIYSFNNTRAEVLIRFQFFAICFVFNSASDRQLAPMEIVEMRTKFIYVTQVKKKKKKDWILNKRIFFIIFYVFAKWSCHFCRKKKKKRGKKTRDIQWIDKVLLPLNASSKWKIIHFHVNACCFFPKFYLFIFFLLLFFSLTLCEMDVVGYVWMI